MKEFELKINKKGVKSHGGFEIPSGFIFRFKIDSVNLNTVNEKKESILSVKYSGSFFLNKEQTEPLLLHGAISEEGQPLFNFANIIANCVTEKELTLKINEDEFIQNVRLNLSEMFKTDIRDIVLF